MHERILVSTTTCAVTAIPCHVTSNELLEIDKLNGMKQTKIVERCTVSNSERICAKNPFKVQEECVLCECRLIGVLQGVTEWEPVTRCNEKGG